jgi:hypothetical protein
MSITIKVNGTMNSVVHKGSNHFSMATIPDVCKTPSPGGPVPLPYPNVSLSSSLAKGTTTVKADGGNMIAVKGSEFSMSQGDEPGTVGGVKSSTFKKESTWITYSFDVKIEGKNACRLTDKKFQNHENTVDMVGTGGIPRALLEQFARLLCRYLKECTDAQDNGKPPARDQCRQSSSKYPGKTYGQERGLDIDKCVKDKVNKAKKPDSAVKLPGYRDPVSRQTTPQVPVPGLGGNCEPDVIVGTPPKCDAAYDIKTNCPPRSKANGKPPWPTYGDGSNYTYTAAQESWHGKTQEEVYEKACGVKPTMIHANSPECQ